MVMEVNECPAGNLANLAEAYVDMHEIPTHIVSEFVFLSLAVNPKR